MNIIPFLKQWKLIVSISAPVLLLIIPYLWKGGHTGKEPAAAYVILLMAVFWVFECVPLAITSLLPVILFPLLGVMSSDKVSTVYLHNSVLFLMGGVIIALAVEKCNLHTRIAIKVMLLIGAKIPYLLLGMMLTTMTLSMWMNNTSTTAMMIPIVNAILEQIKREMLAQHKSQEEENKVENNSDDMELETLGEENSIHKRKESLDSVHKKKSGSKAELEDVHRKIRNLQVMFLLSVAYASNIGGTGVITGSGTNVIAVALIRQDSEQDYCPEECKEYLKIGFVSWMMFNVPTMILNTLACWAYLMIHFGNLSLPLSWKFWGKNKKDKKEKTIEVKKGKASNTLEQNITEAIQEKYAELGSISFDEICVCIIFAFTVLLWITPLTQIPVFKKYGPSFIREATPTFLSCIILFIVPRKKDYFRNIMKGGLGEGLRDPLLTWDFVHEKFPWGVFILLGGGSAIASGAKESGLNKWIGEVLERNELLKALPTPVLLIIILILITILTTIAANTATAAMITPVLLALCYVKGIHPMYMVLPAATACSYAFMLPVSTSPNAIAYGSSNMIKIWDMISCGFVLNVLTMTILFVTTNTLNNWIFQFDNYNNECRNMTGIPAH